MGAGVQRGYIAYVKANCQLTLTDSVIPARHPIYMDMRRVGDGRGQSAAYAGQLGAWFGWRKLTSQHAVLGFS